MSLSVIDGSSFNDIEAVAKLKLEGKTDTAVAKELGIQRKLVTQRWNAYREILSEDASSRDAARDQLHQMVAHYDKLIEMSYSIYTDLKKMDFDEKIANQMNAVIKNIGALEATRADHLAKAGLLEAGDLGDELAEMEAERQVLINILRNDLCPACKAQVAVKIQKVTGTPEVIEVMVHE